MSIPVFSTTLDILMLPVMEDPEIMPALGELYRSHVSGRTYVVSKLLGNLVFLSVRQQGNEFMSNLVFLSLRHKVNKLAVTGFFDRFIHASAREDV